MRKIKKLAWIVVLAVAIPVTSQAQGERLYVYSADGAVQSFALEDLRKITFSEQGVTVHPKIIGHTPTFLYNDVSVMTFKSKLTAIPAVKISDVKLFLETDNLLIESNTEISAVKLYNLQGRLLTQQALQSLSANISLSAYPAGIYIVQVVNQQGVSIHKIIKQ